MRIVSPGSALLTAFTREATELTVTVRPVGEGSGAQSASPGEADAVFGMLTGGAIIRTDNKQIRRMFLYNGHRMINELLIL